MHSASAKPFTAAQAKVFMRDFALGLVVFAVWAGAFSVSHGNAFPAPPPAELLPAALAVVAIVPPLAVAAPALPIEGVASGTLPLLAVAFSTLMAFNMAVWRHLRTAYASPRRRS